MKNRFPSLKRGYVLVARTLKIFSQRYCLKIFGLVSQSIMMSHVKGKNTQTSSPNTTEFSLKYYTLFLRSNTFFQLSLSVA